MATLFEMTSAAMRLYELLQADEIDEQTVSDTLEAMGADEKLESYCKIEKQMEADVDMIKAEIDRLTQRKRTLERSIDRMKEAVAAYMRATGKDKADVGTFRISFRRSKAVEITDEDKLPDRFFLAQPPKVDKIAIKEALNAGETVEGAMIVEREGVQIR